MRTLQFVLLSAIVSLAAAAPVTKPGTVAAEDPQLYIDVRFLIPDEKTKRGEAAPQLYTDRRLIINEDKRAEKTKEPTPQLYLETI